MEKFLYPTSRLIRQLQQPRQCGTTGKTDKKTKGKKIENPKVDQHIFVQLTFFIRVPKQFNKGRSTFSTNDAEEIGCLN